MTFKLLEKKRLEWYVIYRSIFQNDNLITEYNLSNKHSITKFS